MVTSTDVFNEICSIFDISASDMKYDVKSIKAIWCRKLFSFICYEKLGLSMSDVSRKLNRSKTYGKYTINQLSVHINNADPEWIKAWQKYEDNSTLLCMMNHVKGEPLTISIIPKEREVVCSETGKVYESIQKASLDLNIKYMSLYCQLSGRYTNKTTLILR